MKLATRFFLLIARKLLYNHRQLRSIKLIFSCVMLFGQNIGMLSVNNNRQINGNEFCNAFFLSLWDWFGRYLKKKLHPLHFLSSHHFMSWYVFISWYHHNNFQCWDYFVRQHPISIYYCFVMIKTIFDSNTSSSNEYVCVCVCCSLLFTITCEIY